MSASTKPRKPSRADPTLAAVLTWVLPGAGHLVLGHALLGIAAFLAVNGLYWLGLRLSEGMTFEWLEPELRSAFAPALSPEALNLGGLVWQIRQHGFGPDYPRPFPETMRLGSTLCALSGVANALLMVHAHVLARTGDARRGLAPARAVALTFLVPGLGHLAQGRRLRAALVLALLVGLFAVGTLLAEQSNLSRERHFYYWAGQFLLGLPAFAAELALGDARVSGHIPYVEAGLVFGCVAGLLNVLAMIDAYAWEERELLGIPHGRPAGAPAGANAPANASAGANAPADAQVGANAPASAPAGANVAR